MMYQDKKNVLYTFIVTIDNFTTIGDTSDFQILKTLQFFSRCTSNVRE